MGEGPASSMTGVCGRLRESDNLHAVGPCSCRPPARPGGSLPWSAAPAAAFSCRRLPSQAAAVAASCASADEASSRPAPRRPCLRPSALMGSGRAGVARMRSEGCDFPGFSVRRWRGGTVLLIKLSTAAVRRIRKRLAAEAKARTSRSTGSPPATSACSTRPGGTGGSSATPLSPTTGPGGAADISQHLHMLASLGACLSRVLGQRARTALRGTAAAMRRCPTRPGGEERVRPGRVRGPPLHRAGTGTSPCPCSPTPSWPNSTSQASSCGPLGDPNETPGPPKSALGSGQLSLVSVHCGRDRLEVLRRRASQN